MNKDASFNFYRDRSKAFEAEVKNILHITMPDANPLLVEYVARRIDVMRLNYEASLLNKINKTLDKQSE